MPSKVVIVDINQHPMAPIKSWMKEATRHMCSLGNVNLRECINMSNNEKTWQIQIIRMDPVIVRGSLSYAVQTNMHATNVKVIKNIHITYIKHQRTNFIYKIIYLLSNV